MTPARSLLLLAMLLGLGPRCGAASIPPSAPNAAIGKTAELSLPTDRGDLATIPGSRPRTLVVDLFAPSCTACKDTLPPVWARRDALHVVDAELVLIAVLADSESTADARRALAGWGVPEAPFLVDSGQASKRELGVTSLPATVVLDPRGVVRWIAPPGASADDVVAAARAAAHPY